ncbi:coiled-coil domain-containing protein 148-like [Haliotis asinina]|uniref:coiled-coil domain-containing protein 148-like n=1 Tax=Haliotis asinina TaxID=109174 RepID=UPI00353187BC
MSGRDYRSFVTNHRAEEMDRLVRRMSDGVRSNMYDHNVDYNKLKAMAMEKRFSGHKTLMKVQKIEQLSKQTKENHLLKQQRLVWQKEFIHLNHLRKKQGAEIDLHIQENCIIAACRQLYQDAEYYQAGLDKDLEKFKLDTVEPVWNLRDDLTYWLKENKEELRLGAPEVIEHHAQIMDTIASVKQQQKDILDKLKQEQRCLEQELLSDELLELCPPQMEKRPKFVDGIPPEAYDLECPDESLKVSVLEEFLILDQKYYARLANLDSRHRKALSSDHTGGWDDEDHFTFVAVYDQYPTELQNRRKLLVDRLKRHLPHMNRAELMEHEDWWLDFKHYNERHKSILSDWLRDRRELLVKARLVFAEAAAAQDLEDLKEDSRQKQLELCEALYTQVLRWREQKMEVMQLEMELEQKRAEEMAELEQARREREQERRQKQKHKISEYHQERQERRRKQEERDRYRLQELQTILEEQAEFDRERVKFREEQLERRREERQMEQEAKVQEDLERERRLEVLREQVRPIAESDPERLLKQTEAWQARLAEEEYEESNIQKPLFNINTFTANQVTSDPRVRLEQKLRDAGLHKSDYARQVLSQVKPLHPPRKDMESTVLKYD